MDFMLKRVVGGKLKKLTISAYFRESKMQFLEYLIEANEGRQGRQLQQEQKQQEGGTISIPGPLTDESVTDGTENRNENNNLQGHEGRGFELNELVLKDWLGYRSRKDRSKLDLEWLYDCSGVLPIRALSFINFETWTRHPFVPDDEEQGDDEVGADEPGSSILPILSKCPDLEKLCVSFDLRPVLPDNSSSRFINSLTEESHYYNSEASGYKVGKEDDDFVEEMRNYCPKLREIEFGMFYQLTSDHWIEMMELYGHQLESLSIWGNVPAFNSKAFMTFLGRPVSDHTIDRLNPLTRLNINGMEHLHECAWMALYMLSNLKEFRARDVPLDAESLIDGNWICRGLEVLEICVAIPKRTRWEWSDTHGWTKVHKHYKRDMKGGRKDGSMGEDTDEDEEIQDDTAEALKRRLMYLGAERPTKKARVDWMECIDTQVKVCKALGRLTQLRELRIEGRRHFEFGKRDWGCLALTLETGLEHLAPLRQNLEKLFVSGLDEGLSGRKEVEWIARNWVHHSNSRWLEQHHASSQSMEEPEGNRMTGVRSEDDVSFDPRSKFKELNGISEEAQGAKSNIKWLQEQCPTLSVWGRVE
ncbi:MAG: hypothetical protein J3Q66DRAFT_382789 [Benniella sp.]|nr:MAG: hypothetical protein J3Q66DRAFT_382789 [Benniella sp.]